ncbi:MAG: nucleoside triphosphate pyrophosphohydrolase [Bacteroidales bacterium]|nr:nucleoside triphosphate pyrophosphohydrolase [Bacteroidales bacterium]
MHTKEENLALFSKVLDIMGYLRSRCSWNASQTFESLRTQTLEEVYELSDAVLKGADPSVKKELGDLLLHIVFYSRIAQEEGRWDIGDVMESLCQKMIFRHPHVFPGGVYPPAENARKMTPEEVSTAWEMLKSKEKDGNKTVLSGVPDAMPPILKAYAMQDKARGVGFDWRVREEVWDKVKEELGEVMEAAGENDPVHEEEEFGDLFFAVINACRLYGVNPDTALNKACDKFRRRFGYLEENTIKQGRDLHEMSLEEMDVIWEEGKSKGL